tara:strand:- start:2656 stop:2982 length:327 start_codon:yes stop_codon:yes gene_type:complete
VQFKVAFAAIEEEDEKMRSCAIIAMALPCKTMDLMFAPFKIILLPVGIITSFDEPGTPDGLQKVGSLKNPSEGPIQVLVWAERFIKNRHNTENSSNRFIIAGVSVKKN